MQNIRSKKTVNTSNIIQNTVHKGIANNKRKFNTLR